MVESKKGISALSWGSRTAVDLEDIGASRTRITVTTRESFAITDWGRGKRRAKQLLDAVGAQGVK